MDRHTDTIHMHGVHCTYKYTQHKISMPYKLFRIMRSLTDPLILGGSIVGSNEAAFQN